jgi:hypothetical protein
MRALFLGLVLVWTQASAQLLLKINDASPVTIDSAALAQLPRHTATLDDHGKTIHFDGVLLNDILAKNGVDLSKPLRGPKLSIYLAAIGNDGYEAVYALAELDPTIADAQLLVADHRDGAALKREEGPLRLIAPHDKRAARSITMLHEIDVLQLKR